MSVKDCFNKAAANYDLHCQLQIAIGEELLNLIKPAESVIDIGCGTGIITEKLKYKKLYALDLSDKMLEIAKNRLGEHNVEYLETSFDNFSNLNLDLAFANMSLQWSNNLEKTLTNIKANLNPGGMLAFSLPIKGSFTNLNIPTISFIEFKKIEKFLENWQLLHSFSKEYTYIFPSMIEALKSIKAVGANYCNSPKKTLISRDKKPQILKYNIGYFVARNNA